MRPTPVPVVPIRDDYSSEAIDLLRDAGFSSGNVQLRLRRWDAPVAVFIGGSPTSDDITTVHGTLQEIAAVTGHPIRVVDAGEASNVDIFFVPRRDFAFYLPGVNTPESVIGYARWWTSNYRMTRSVIVVDFARSGYARSALVIHELAHAFGINHADEYPDSLYAPINTGRSEYFRPVDLEAMKLLYDSRLWPGMSVTEFDVVAAR